MAEYPATNCITILVLIELPMPVVLSNGQVSPMVVVVPTPKTVVVGVLNVMPGVVVLVFVAGVIERIVEADAQIEFLTLLGPA
jgi:hypothetical protein